MFPGFDDAYIKIDRGDRNFRFKLVLYPPHPSLWIGRGLNLLLFMDLQINDMLFLVLPL